ncbi:MAG TPA: cytochrome P450 [Candidatus Angelobacter sp.]|nr:cytochrome P450 [Candidatus Angelobacter sp.]
MASSQQVYPGIAPGPGIASFFTDVRTFRQDPLGSFLRYTLKFGDVVRYRGLWVTHQITHPEHILQVLQTNAGNYRKGRDYRILKLSLGEGLLTSEGTLWQRQRRMTQPAFQSQQIAGFMRVMEKHALEMLTHWEQRARTEEVFDVVPELMRLTLNIVSHALFTSSLESDLDCIQDALTVGRDYSVERAWSVVRIPQWLPTPGNRRHRSSLAGFHSVIDRMISARRMNPDHSNDLLTILMQARDETGSPMPAKQLRDEVATLLTAGHETTTLVLAWAIYLISTRSEVVERMASEISFLNGRAPSYEDLSRLRYTRMVAEETMRLYPPVWVISRTAINNDAMGGFEIPAGSEILIFPYVTHRHPGWWVDPDRFCPERFLPQNSAGRPRGAYLPFGAGPRTCVGLNFAMTEILVVLALLLQRFRIELAVPSSQIKAEPSVTLRPNPGVPIRLRRI